MSYARRLPSTADNAERLLAKTKRTPGGCWEWAASTSKGYGTFWLNGRGVWAYKAAYELMVGPVDPGLHLDHLCRNTLCVNPAHLEPVTPAENIRRGLRGVLRTHCARGHELTPANTYVWGNCRKCRTCNRENQKAFQQRKRVA